MNSQNNDRDKAGPQLLIGYVFYPGLRSTVSPQKQFYWSRSPPGLPTTVVPRRWSRHGPGDAGAR